MPSSPRLVIVLSLLTLLILPLHADETTPTSTELIGQAEDQMATGEIDTAIATLQLAIETDPHSTLAHTRLGGAYLIGQRYTEAIAQFQQAIRIDPDNGAAFIGLGMAYLHGDQSGPAQRALTEAKRLLPAKADEIDVLLGRIEP